MALVWYRKDGDQWRTDPMPGTGEIIESETWQGVYAQLWPWYGARGFPAVVDLPLTPTVRSAYGAASTPYAPPGDVPAQTAATAAKKKEKEETKKEDSDNDDDGDDMDFSLFD